MMDVFDLLLQTGILTIVLVFYLIVFRGKPNRKHGAYTQTGWNYPLKLVCARFAVSRWRKKLWEDTFYSFVDHAPRTDLSDGTDSWTLRASAPDGTSLLLVIRKLCREQPLAEIVVHVQLPDGTAYKLPRHPDTVVGAWDCEEGEWNAGGLKIQVLQTWKRLRVVYNGMLVRTKSNTLHHARLNLIWTCASGVVSHPEDWNTTLATRALATEPWRNGQWHKLLASLGESGNLQWGCVQGWFQAQGSQEIPEVKTWLQARGVSEHMWTWHGYRDLRRSISLMVTCKDGTAVHLRGHSYNGVFTEIFSGTVRTPNTTVETIKSTDLIMADFCETKTGIPNKYIINISTDARNVKLVLNIGHNGERLLNGVPYQQETIYRNVLAQVNGDIAAGILELGYTSSETCEPSVRLAVPRTLRWLPVTDVHNVSYCAAFDSPAATCPQLVGGKGASLALLSSVQQTQGYKVPPGFCLTTKALETYLDENTELKSAIGDIKLANDDYEESNFKQKCERTVSLFQDNEIKGELRESILENLNNLRIVAKHQFSEIRFAVRSSAIGEDSEALSAAGQNDTVLGCASDADVLRAVLKCWGSMFTFTSAHYRRQNGQPCMTGAGVVVQVLVPPRAAGVLFTRHPQAGDPSRILITANYGLGESVVSGTVEPDTFIISRDLDNNVQVLSVELGSKKHSIVSGRDNGIISEEVSEKDRGSACLSNEEAIRLGQLAIAQEQLWGAPRDIEWAINQNGVYLLQARPITSLEMWTEEELLHEMDDPMMAEEELLSFGNTGEVMPKPLTPLSQTVVFQPMNQGINEIFLLNLEPYDQSLQITHHRCIMNMYNTLYRRMPAKLDITVRMMEMATHGHLVADDRIHGIAIRRRPPSSLEQFYGFVLFLKSLIKSKSYVKTATKAIQNMNFDNVTENDLNQMFAEILKISYEELKVVSYAHCGTSTASSASNIVAMTVLLEKADNFTNEHCNDLAEMLSCGDAVSAEVPTALYAMSQKLKSSVAEEFKAVPPQDGMKWLHDNFQELHKEAVLFLEKHGHRAVMEFDMATVPWAIDPTGFIAILQSMQMSTAKDTVKVLKSDKEIIASLITPKKSITRNILRWFLPLCRKMVRRREETKAQLILGVHKLRLVMRRLGKRMQQEWLLPNLELVFYFTLEELRTYIKTRDPTLLKKATQRQQFYPKWEKQKFAEVHEGWPKPQITEGPRVASAGAKITATPICGGEVIARACVVPDLSEIKQLQHGDILITHCTDIGWSPYFPLLTGIVTELGGLISHGAVIARECGLPCIVGAADATELFQTGDLVRINGTTGELEKVKQSNPEIQEEQDVVKNKALPTNGYLA